MPDGNMQMESYDGVLRIVNVSREMTGSYRCQTSQYNGFNVKPREAVVELIVQCEYNRLWVFFSVYMCLHLSVYACCATACSSDVMCICARYSASVLTVMYFLCIQCN